MTDVTIADPTSPQTQPGGVRDSSGTIQDSPSTTPAKPASITSTQTDGTTEGSTFLTGKKAEPELKATEGEVKDPAKVEPKTEPAAGAPDKYTDFKLPDGHNFDPTALGEFQTAAKAANLTQESAQALVDVYAKHALASAKAPYDLWANTQKEWNGEILSRFGGESGADKLRADVNGVINRVLPPTLQKTFRAALDFTGAGSNPDILEAFSIMLKPHFEGRPVPSGNPSNGANNDPSKTPSGPVDIAAAMYPHLVNNRPK